MNISDYPHNWPTMFGDVLRVVNDPMRYLDFIISFYQTANEQQIVFAHEEVYTILAWMIALDTGHNNTTEATRKALLALQNYVLGHYSLVGNDPVFKAITESLCSFLLVCIRSPNTDLAMKQATLNTIFTWLEQMPETVTTFIELSIPTILEVFNMCGQIFTHDALFKSSLPYLSVGDVVETPNLHNVARYCIAILKLLLDRQRGTAELTHDLPLLLYNIIFFIDTPEQYEMTEPLRPVYDKSRQLLVLMTQELHYTNMQLALYWAVRHHMEFGRTTGGLYYAEISASVIYAVCSISPFFLDLHSKNRLLEFDILYFLNEWIIEYQSVSLSYSRTIPYILWLGGLFSKIMPIETLSAYVTKTVQNLENSHVKIRLAALRALCYHTESFTVANNTFLPIAHHIAGVLIQQLAHQEGTIVFIRLRALRKVLKVPGIITESIKLEIVNLTVNVFLANIGSPETVRWIHPLLKRLCQQPRICEYIKEQFMPNILNILRNPERVEAEIKITIETLKVIVMEYPTLNEDLALVLYFTVQDLVGGVNDCDLLEHSSACLNKCLLHLNRTVPVAAEHPVNFAQNVVLLNVLINRCIVLEFCSPQITSVLTLSLQIIRDNPQLDDVGWIMDSVVDGLHRTTNDDVEDMLISIAIYFFCHKIQLMLIYLDTGGALVFIMTKWLTRRRTLKINYQYGLHILAMQELVYQIIDAEDERLVNLTIDGRPIWMYVSRIVRSIMSSPIVINGVPRQVVFRRTNR